MSLSALVAAGEAVEVQGRKRSKLACKTCRELKRKCDGAQPCGTCVRFEYECTYETVPGSKRRRVQERVVAETSPPQVSPSHNGSHHGPAGSIGHSASPLSAGQQHPTAVADAAAHIRSLEANSGAAFMRNLALRLDPHNAPRMHSFAWNAFLGARRLARPPVACAITDTISLFQMQELADSYFRAIDPIYGFMDRQVIDQQIIATWRSGGLSPADEAVLCGIAALGSLFSAVEPSPAELDLVETARVLLDPSSPELPTVTVITAWILRIVYLRVAGTHHTAWMASCMLMHMIEASGLHLEHADQEVSPSTTMGVQPELRRRLVAIALHLNIWTSFDMGRSRVAIAGLEIPMPMARPGDYTLELIELLPYSAQLDPERAPNATELEEALSAVLDRTHSAPPSRLAQCNLALCLCRRLQAMSPGFATNLLPKILEMTKTGVAAAQAIMEARHPWHHMVYVPFQIVCVLLAIDTVSAISQVRGAMQCLRNIVSVYNTDATQESLRTASLLILLHKRWKEKSASDLSEILELFPLIPPNQQVLQPGQMRGNTSDALGQQLNGAGGALDTMAVQQPDLTKWFVGVEETLNNLQDSGLDQYFPTGLWWEGDNFNFYG